MGVAYHSLLCYTGQCELFFTSNKIILLQIRFRGLSDTIRLLGCFSLNTVNVPPCNTGDENKKWRIFEKQFSQSGTQHQPLSTQESTDSIRSSVTFEGTLEIDPTSVLFAANEMLKSLFDMATDSFGLRSGSSVVCSVELESTCGKSGMGIPYIYHPGAITAAMDLLPAISERNDSVLTEVENLIM